MGTMIEQSPRFKWSDLPTDITTSLPFLVKLLVTDANGESISDEHYQIHIKAFTRKVPAAATVLPRPMPRVRARVRLA